MHPAQKKIQEVLKELVSSMQETKQDQIGPNYGSQESYRLWGREEGLDVALDLLQNADWDSLFEEKSK